MDDNGTAAHLSAKPASADATAQSAQSAPAGTGSNVKRSITIATMIMMGSIFLSHVMGLVREQVLAFYGGTSYEIDAYVTAFLIPELLNHFLAGGFLSITFIPIFQKHIVAGDMDRAWRSMSNLLTIGSLLFLILIPLTIIFAPQIMGILGTDPAHKPLTIRLTRIILLPQIFFYWFAFLGGVQIVNNRFFLFGFAPLLYNLGIISGGLILGPILGIEGFAWGVVAGAFVGNFIIQLPGAVKVGMRYRPRIDLRDPDLLTYIKTTIPLVLGIGMSFSIEVFFRFFGSYLPEGGTASVNFGLRTMMVVVAVFGQAPGVAFYPFLARYAAEKQLKRMTDLLHSVLTRIALYILPLSGIMIVLSHQIISVLYQHGKFNAESTARTAGTLSIFLFGAFTFSGSMIIQRMFFALQRTVLPMVISTTVAAVSIPLYIVLSSSMGPGGIALVAVLAMSTQFIVLYLIWCKTFADRESIHKAIITFVKALLITTVTMLFCLACRWASDHLLPQMNRIIRDLSICVIAGGTSLVLVFFLYELTGIQKMRDSIKGLLRRNS